MNNNDNKIDLDKIIEAAKLAVEFEVKKLKLWGIFDEKSVIKEDDKKRKDIKE